MAVDRYEVFRSDRIRETEAIIRNVGANRVLEVGAGDYSFDYVRADDCVLWTKADLAAPCDLVCDLNSESLVLPFGDTSFDLVICTQVLEHLLWPQRLLAEARRVLATDGHILVSIPNIASLTYRIAWMMGRLPSCAASGNLPPGLGNTAYTMDSGRLFGGHVIDFNLSRILGLLKLFGFSPRSVKGSGIIWHKQILPSWMVPPSLSSNIIVLGQKF